MTRIVLRLTGRQHSQLRTHLFPGDGNEAVAVALCGRHGGHDFSAMCVHEILLIPHDECPVREPDSVVWPTDRVIPLLQRASNENMAIVKFHSHPGGYGEFSSIDDESDSNFFSSVHGWTDSDDPHASAIMLPNGRLLGRVVLPDGSFENLTSIAVAGDDLAFWQTCPIATHSARFVRRHAQLFGEETVSRLQQLRIAVVGCSGTGSPVIEMLARLGVGHLVLIDPDQVEDCNLNRILNSTHEDAVLGRAKVDVLAAAVARMGFGTTVTRVAENVATKRAIAAIAGSDVVFGCVDGAFGRSVLDRIATYYCIPYFDLGVALESDRRGGITEAIGAVHYIQPDQSSLRDRRVYTSEQVQAEGIRLTNPAEYALRLRERYISGVAVDRPAVISINMQIAATAVNEFLSRLHPFRTAGNEEFAVVRTSFFHGETFHEPDRLPIPTSRTHVGRGDVNPLLGMPAIQ